MDTYALMCDTNRQFIMGRRFNDAERRDITDALLGGVSGDDTVCRFNKGVKAPDTGKHWYPLFFIPPYNGGKKLLTITGVTPKTQIFSANHYELEILRLLALWRPDDPRVQHMLERTKERLNTACFGRFCSMGECFETSVVVLRFLAAADPNDTVWQTKLLDGIRGGVDLMPNGKKRNSGTLFYYWLTLTELHIDGAESEIWRYEQVLKHTLSRSHTYASEYDRLYNAVRVYIARNCLARLPGYSYVKNIEGYEGSDGRYHMDVFDISEQLSIEYIPA